MGILHAHIIKELNLLTNMYKEMNGQFATLLERMGVILAAISKLESLVSLPTIATHPLSVTPSATAVRTSSPLGN